MIESSAEFPSSDCARQPLAARIRLADEAVARIAAFPIEMLGPFAASGLAALASDLTRTKSDLALGAAGLLAELFQAVSRTSDKRTRRWLLEVKRTVYNGLGPWRQPDVREQEVLARTLPDLWRRLEDEGRARRRLLELRQQLAAAYDTEFEKQRRALRSVTESSRFARALSLANPRLARRWRRLPFDAPRTKRARHLERAVLHYLLRAVGRTTPSDAWAGVAQVSLSNSAKDLDTSPAAVRSVAAPDLLPFRQIVERLARSPRYLEGYPLRMDPAAHHDDEQWWGIGACGSWLSVPRDPFVDVITDNFNDGAAPPVDPLIEFLAPRSVDPVRTRALLERAVVNLIEAGVLRSSLEFPAAPSSAWEALESVTPMLMEPEKSAWVRAVQGCRSACDELTAGYESLTAEAIERLHETARLAIRELSLQIGVDEQPPAQVIKFDCTVPFAICWSARLMQRMQEAVVTVLNYHAQTGGAEVFRRELLSELRMSALTLAEAIRTQPDLDGRALRAGLAHFAEGARKTHVDEAGLLDQTDASPGPYGTLMFMIGGEPGLPYFTWGRSTPDFASCRAYQLLNRTERDLSFIGELHPDNIQPLEVVGVDAANPNATIRLEARKSRQIGRHAGTITSFSNLVLEVDQNGRPWLRLAGEVDRFVPTYSAPAGIGITEPSGRFLVRLAMAHGWEFLSMGVPLALLAADSDALEPVQVRREGSVLGLQQWLLPANVVRELRCSNGVDQYCMWREIVERAGIGDWVWVGPATPPDTLPALLRTDSPLLLTIVLERLPVNCGSLALTSLPGDPASWPVKDAEGNHYLCELAVTWADSEHWREVCS